MSKKNETILTKQDFIESGWKKVIEGIEQKESHYYSSAFNSKINDISDEKTKGIFLLLAILLTSRLNLESRDNPFANIDRLIILNISTSFQKYLMKFPMTKLSQEWLMFFG